MIEDKGMSRLRLFLGFMFDLEIPELSFSSASSGFSEQNQEKNEDTLSVDVEMLTIDCIILTVTESVHSLSCKLFWVRFRGLRFFVVIQRTCKILKIFFVWDYLQIDKILIWDFCLSPEQDLKLTCQDFASFDNVKQKTM